MSRLILRSGAVGDYDGAYDWVSKEDYDNPDYTPGYHKSESGWPEDAYTIVETVKAAEVEALRKVAQKAERYVYWLHRPCDGETGPAVTENTHAALSALEQALRDALAKRGEEASKNREAHLEPDEGE